MEFDFYDLVWFWNNKSYGTKLMLVQWIGVSHSIGSTLSYWILSQKWNIISRTTVHNLNTEKPRDPNVQEHICDYNGFLEAALGSEYFGISLDGYDSFINDYEQVNSKGEPNEE